MKTHLALVILLGLAAAAPSSAADYEYGSKVELSLMAGARFGGSFSNGNYDIADSVQLSDLSLRTSPSWGAFLGWNFNENGQLELSYNRQPTELRVNDPGTIQDSTLTAVNLDTGLASVLYRFGRYYDRSRPWMGVGLGVTRMRAEDAETDFRFAFSVTGGTHIALDSRWSFRLQARFITTYIAKNDALFCRAGCWSGTSKSYIRQFDAAAGLTLKL